MSELVRACRLGLPGRLQETELALRAGELTCLIGPNGSGKTSLLHALAGIGYPSGEVLIDGVDPKALPPEQRQRLLSYLPAAREVHWPLTAHAIVALGCPAAEDDRAIARVLADLELQAFSGRRIDRMSTGERSRVLIARALVARPKLLLLDEPVANLDPYWQLRLMDYLRLSARERGQAMLVAAHDLELARSFADRVIIMSGGRVEADGTAAELFAGSRIAEIFKVEREGGRWRPLA